MNAVTEVMDELRKALSEVDDIRASLRRKVRHCDELIEERDQMERERDEARERNTDLRKMLEQTARALNHAEEAMVRLETQRDEARAALATCPDCVMYAKRSARFAEQADQLQRERDEARRACDQYLRERDLALQAEERARASLDELDEAIYDCLPSDDDGATPLDCVEHAADRLRDLAQERDEARAEVERLRREHDEMFAELRDLSKKYDGCDAFRRGAEAMREACIGYCHKIGFHGLTVDIRALPIPEEP